MRDIVVLAENLGKRYRIGERERYVALRDVLSRAVHAPARLFTRRQAASSNGNHSHIWALKDVSFGIREGEVVGVIGRNGAGKSTLLKILARVTKPTQGFAEVRGRMGTLLEVGTGFHPELTGRENVLLSGAILGMSRAEIHRKFDEIVAFAEVEKFIDTPLKHYSTGMQMRLAFAVAAHLEPEILLVDEVLSVGDLEFQKKCLGKMGDVARAGRTIIFVSHQMNQIRRLCERVMWIDRGKVRKEGATGLVVGAYEASMQRGANEHSARTFDHGVKAQFQAWELLDSHEEQGNLLCSFGPVSFRFLMQVNKAVRMGTHGIGLYNSSGQLLWGTAAYNLELQPGSYDFVYTLPTLPLRPGPYHWRVTLYDEGRLVDLWESVPELLVSTEPLTHPLDEWAGVLNIPYQFRIKTDDSEMKAPATRSRASIPHGNPGQIIVE